MKYTSFAETENYDEEYYKKLQGIIRQYHQPKKARFMGYSANYQTELNFLERYKKQSVTTLGTTIRMCEFLKKNTDGRIYKELYPIVSDKISLILGSQDYQQSIAAEPQYNIDDPMGGATSNHEKHFEALLCALRAKAPSEDEELGNLKEGGDTYSKLEEDNPPPPNSWICCSIL